MEWAEKWQMQFNVDKCKTPHAGYKNPQRTYNMSGRDLLITDEEKDFGVIVDKNVSFGILF